MFKLPSKFTYFKSEKMTSKEMFEKTLLYIGNIARLNGCHILSPHFSMTNLMLVLLWIDVFTYHSISFQNIYVFSDDFVRVIFCVVTLGMGFQVAMILYTFILDRKQIQKLVELTRSFHSSAKSEKAIKNFERWIMISCHLGCLFILSFYGSGVTVFFYPIVVYLFTGQKILHFGFVIPGMNWESLIGYSINFAHHALQIYFVINNLLFSNLYILFFILNGFAQYDALEMMLDTLSELAVSSKNEDNDRKIKSCIADITEAHVKLLE